MFGAVGDGVTDDTVAIQDMFDNAPAGATIHFAPGTYSVTNGVIIRRHNLTVTGSGATIRADADLEYGTLLGIANATNVTVRGLTLDVNENFDNGLTVIGNTDEFSGFLSALVGTNYCSGIFIEGVSVYRTRFDINLVEGLNFAGPPSFTVGELVRLGNDEKYLTATVLTNDVVNNQAVVRYAIDRFPIASSIEGITSGYVATIDSRTSIPQVSPNGTSYASLQGAFGGKGISIQYGTRGVIVTGCYTFDCDAGLTIESREVGASDTTGIVITGCLFKNSGRTGIWLLAAGTPENSASVYGPVITGCRIQNWGHTFGGFGAISSDRAQYVRMTGILATQDPDYTPASPAVLWVGTVANSQVEITTELQETGGLLDFRKHPPWGNSPGNLVDGSENNQFTLKSTVASVTPDVTWTNSEDTYDIVYYAVNWEADPANALKLTSLNLISLGWDTTAWIGKQVSTVRYDIEDMSASGAVAIGTAGPRVEFDSSYRYTVNGLGAVGERIAMRVNDRMDVAGRISFAGNLAQIGWDPTNSVGFLNALSGTFRLRNTASEDIALLASGGFSTPSSAFSGKSLIMGTRKLWFDGGTLYSKSGTPSSATDGSYVVPARVGTVVLVGGTATVADTATSATDIILLTSQVGGGTPGWVRVSGRVDATSFTITSSSGTDTSTIGYFIWKP